MERLRAIIYTRVSTGKQAEEGTGLEVQEAACLRKAKELDAEVVDIISDEGVSGAFYLSRPGIQKALSQMEAGEARLLITMKLDRTGRDVDIIRLIQKRVTNAGGQLVFADGTNFENNATGKLMLTQLAGFAEYERELIRERTLSGLRKRAIEGIQPSRRFSPFGYHIVNKADVLRGDYPSEQLGTYQTVSEQAEWAKAIFIRYAAGESLRTICRWLQSNNVPRPRGGSIWLPCVIKCILSNPVYKGCPVWGKQQRKVDETRLQKGKKLAHYNVPVPPENWIPLSAPVLVDADIWERCQERLKGNQSTLGGNPTRRYMLSGLLRCPVCGGSMAGQATRGRGYYQCGKSRAQGTIHGQVCPINSIRVDMLDNLILRDLTALSKKPEGFEQAWRTFLSKQKAETGDEDGKRHDITTQLTRLDAQEQATATAQIEALMHGRNTAVYERLLEEINAKRSTLQARLASISVQSKPSVSYPSKASQIAEVLRRVEDVLRSETMTPAEKHSILSLIIHRITPRGEGYDIELLPARGPSETVCYMSV